MKILRLIGIVVTLLLMVMLSDSTTFYTIGSGLIMLFIFVSYYLEARAEWREERSYWLTTSTPMKHRIESLQRVCEQIKKEGGE